MLHKCLSAKETAEALGISERTSIRLMRSGEIEAFKLHGKLWRTTAAKVSAYQKREFARWREVILVTA